METGLINIMSLDSALWDDFDYRQGWGGNKEYFLFATTITIPEEFNNETVVYRLQTGCEGGWDIINPQFRVYINGKIKQGLDVNHREILLAEKAKANEEFSLILVAYTSDDNYHIQLNSEICILDKLTQQYYYDINVPYQVTRLLDSNDSRSIDILKTLNDSLNLLDLRRAYSPDYYESLNKAQEYIHFEFYEKMCGKNTVAYVYSTGHTHIDCAWLWTTIVTRDKAIRSFSTVIELMKQYPEYRFMSSQPLLYKYVKENAPELYDQIKEKIKEGRWEPEGGMYVEADCNLISGESLVRQFVYGQKFFMKEFNKKSKVLWLPDVFGYSPSLPQIMKKCGIKYFMTTKLNWGEFNKFPYDTFEWAGIDGSIILSYLIPTQDYHKEVKEGNFEPDFFTTYNGIINPSQVKGAWKRYTQKELGNKVLMAYGYGDGGGGPTPEMLENQRRLQKGIPGCPTTVISSVMEYFTALDNDIKNNKKYLPKWVGELYLENHRGTYTSMGIIKKLNRRAEFSLANTELFASVNSLINKKPYPKDQLDVAWELLLKNQFHDIIPGSSIYEVYQETIEDYRNLMNISSRISDDALNDIITNINAPAGSYVVFNPNGFDAKGYIEIDTNRGKECYHIRSIPAKGYAALTIDEMEPVSRGVSVDADKMENQFYIMELNKNGQISRLYDKRTDREIIRNGEAANVLMSYEDRPHAYDAWNINHYYKENSWKIDDVQSVEVVENDGYKACIRISRKYLESTIDQYISMYSESPRIDIRNVIDWKEEHILLRVLFPVDIHSEEATYEVQFGNIKRTAHFNTIWDTAKFEVCAHKWLDFSEGNYGISILNDCKYGCDVHDGIIGLTMLKSAVYPNPHADKEVHEFTYSLLPHAGSWSDAGTVKEAYLLNNPIIIMKKANAAGQLCSCYSLVSADADNVIIETVKKAEDSEDIIIRLYEYQNARNEVTLTFAHNLREVYECDMLENVEKKMEIDGNKISFCIKSYEIKTFKVKL